GLAAVCITLTLAAVFLLRPLAREVRAVHILVAIPLVALATVLLVLISQGCAEWIRGQALPTAVLRSGAALGSPKQILGKFIFFLFASVSAGGNPDRFSPTPLTSTSSASRSAPALWKRWSRALPASSWRASCSPTGGTSPRGVMCSRSPWPASAS